jgi:hypothetical protein
MLLRQVLGALAFLSIGTVFTVFPGKVQEWALKSRDATRGPARRVPLMSWVETPSYRTSVRLIGVLALVAVALIVVAILRR